jgi:hypothetical protein
MDGILWSERVTARREVLNQIRKGWENADYICPVGFYYTINPKSGRPQCCAIGALKLAGYGRISGVADNIEDKLFDLGLNPCDLIDLSDGAGDKAKAIQDIVEYVWRINGREARQAGLTFHQAIGLCNSYLDPLGKAYEAFQGGYLHAQLEYVK